MKKATEEELLEIAAPSQGATAAVNLQLSPAKQPYDKNGLIKDKIIDNIKYTLFTVCMFSAIQRIPMPDNIIDVLVVLMEFGSAEASLRIERCLDPKG